ncbi:MAG: hypothetical protein ROR55_29130 [Devosia sp.]
MTHVEYAKKGLLGVLTPQANTTVEPEMAILTPPGWGVLNARLTSDKPTIEARLVDYFDHYGEALTQFANAPLTAAGFACTGASYLAGASREDDTLAALTERLGAPVVTAATAVLDSLAALGAKRIALVSPYDGALDDASVAYWTGRGLDVVGRFSAFRQSDAFHPIYSLAASASQEGVEKVKGSGAEAIVMLGTGMPTLRAIADAPSDGPPLLSCMFSLAWRLMNAPTEASLRAMLTDTGWRARLSAIDGKG